LILGPPRANTATVVKGEIFPSLIDVTLEELASGLESGLFTSVDLVTAYLARIQEANATTNAVVEINPDALSLAAELDAERANGTVRG
jgi:amidase